MYSIPYSYLPQNAEPCIGFNHGFVGGINHGFYQCEENRFCDSWSCFPTQSAVLMKRRNTRWIGAVSKLQVKAYHTCKQRRGAPSMRNKLFLRHLIAKLMAAKIHGISHSPNCNWRRWWEWFWRIGSLAYPSNSWLGCQRDRDDYEIDSWLCNRLSMAAFCYPTLHATTAIDGHEIANWCTRLPTENESGWNVLLFSLQLTHE